MTALSELGTRTRQTSYQTNAPSGQETRISSRDVGMSKYVVDSMTFTASNSRITGSNGDFSAFMAGDTIVIEGTNLNNGERIVTGIDATNAAYLVLNLPPQNEGPVSGTIVRTT